LSTQLAQFIFLEPIKKRAKRKRRRGAGAPSLPHPSDSPEQTSSGHHQLNAEVQDTATNETSLINDHQPGSKYLPIAKADNINTSFSSKRMDVRIAFLWRKHRWWHSD